MYPLPSTPLPSVSGFIPRPSPTFKPIPPKGQPTVTSPQSSDQPWKDDSIGTSPGSSLPCGQGTPQDPPSSTNESPSLSPQHSPQQVLPQPNPYQQHPLVDHKLIHWLSLSFQLPRHPRMCPAHHSRTFQSLPMVKE